MNIRAINCANAWYPKAQNNIHTPIEYRHCFLISIFIGFNTVEFGIYASKAYIHKDK